MINGSKVLNYLTLIYVFLFALLTRVSILGAIKKQKNQNFGTIFHAEVCLTLLRLAAKLSELAKDFRGSSFKIQP